MSVLVREVMRMLRTDGRGGTSSLHVCVEATAMATAAWAKLLLRQGRSRRTFALDLRPDQC